jgi:diaminopropionate ammonia-lyase
MATDSALKKPTRTRLVEQPGLTWVARTGARDWRAPAAGPGALSFHRSLPGYRPTPLVEMPELAAGLGVARVLVKDESERLGLAAFKILGASWAVERALSPDSPSAGPAPAVSVLVAATDGNHGRALARVARQRGLAAHIFIPPGVHPSVAAAIAAEGATITQTRGTYQEAIALAAEHASSDGRLLVQDMAWPGYTQIPAWIVAGYATMFAEIEAQLEAAGGASADLVAVPVGVGSLAQAAVTHFRRPGITRPPALVSVEADGAACLLRSLERDEFVTVSTSATIMAGLNCGTLSSAAWPFLRSGIDAAVAVSDTQAAMAMRELAACGVPAGPCGAAALAGARVALTGQGSGERRAHLGLTKASTVVLLSTESSSANPALLGGPAPDRPAGADHAR